MKFNVYAIKDTEKGAYLQPFFVPFYQSTEDTIIDFKRNLLAAESIINKFPDKFELWQLGCYFDELGTFNSFDVVDGLKMELIKKIVSAEELLKEKDEDVGNTEIN